jgi:hypothetical protein
MTPRIGPIDPAYPPEVQAEFDRIMRGAPARLHATVHGGADDACWFPMEASAPGNDPLSARR